jgi:hypothetical protein
MVDSRNSVNGLWAERLLHSARNSVHCGLVDIRSNQIEMTNYSRSYRNHAGQNLGEPLPETLVYGNTESDTRYRQGRIAGHCYHRPVPVVDAGRSSMNKHFEVRYKGAGLAEGEEFSERATTREEADQIATDLTSDGYKVLGIDEVRV